jgi:hypothetical protein
MDMLIRLGVFVVILAIMLGTIEVVVPVQGVPQSKYSLEYMLQKNELRSAR